MALYTIPGMFHRDKANDNLPILTALFPPAVKEDSTWTPGNSLSLVGMQD